MNSIFEPRFLELSERNMAPIDNLGDPGKIPVRPAVALYPYIGPRCQLISLLGLLTMIFFCFPGVSHASAEDDARISNREGFLLAQRGDVEGSIRAFERAVKADPQDETARANLATGYNNLGVLLFKKGKYLPAIQSFEAARAQKSEDLQVRINLLSALVAMKDVERVDREAKAILGLRPSDAETILKVANAFQRIEDTESARNLLERVIAAEPANANALFNLGRLYYQQGNLSEARFHLERSIEAAPGNMSAHDLLSRITREEGVERRFDCENSIHFSITFEENISRDWAKDLLDLFEEGYAKVGDLLACYPSQRASIIVYSPENFHRVSSLPGWAGGLYDGKIRLPLPPGTTSPEQLRGAIFHEYTHHLVQILSDGRCPTWLNEGLAQCSEGLSAESAHRSLARLGPASLIPLRDMAGPFSKAKSREMAERLYAQSLCVVSQLIEEKGFPAIHAALEAFSQRQGIDDALSSSIGQSCDSLDTRLRESMD